MSDIDINKLDSLDLEFTCIYDDDSRLEQKYGTPEEKSFKDIDLDKLDVFAITGIDKAYSVDLKNGKFYANGQVISFDLGIETKDDGHTEKIIPEKYRLVYFRRIKKDSSPEGITTTLRYCIGWQTTVNNKNYQRLMFINPDKSITFTNKK